MTTIKEINKTNSTSDDRRTLTIAAMAVVALSYYLFGRMSLLLAVPPGYAAAIWPSAGIALAATLIYGRRIWPAIWMGSLAVNLWLSFTEVAAGNSAVIMAAVLIACGASLQALVSAGLLRKFRVWPNPLRDGRAVALLLLLGGVAGCTINAVVGVMSLLTMGLIDVKEVAFNWLNWWVGDAIGVIIVTPLLLIWTGSMGKFWRRRAAAVSAPSVVALFVVVAFFLIASNREQARVETEFKDTAQNIEAAITTKLNTMVAALGGIQSLFASSQKVDAEEFRNFTRRALDANRELLALSWNSHVSHAQRLSYEATGNATDRLRFTERNAHGNLVEAGIRESYTIVNYIEPLEPNRGVLGFDTGFDHTRLEAIQRARDTGNAAATGRVQLVQADQSEPGLLIFAPIYTTGTSPTSLDERREHIAGFAVGVVLVRHLLESAIAGLRLDHISMRLYDESGSAADQLLATWANDSETVLLMTSDQGIEFAGRSWRVSVGADAEYVAIHRAPGLVMVLAIGLLLCGLLGAFNLTLAGNERREAIRASQDALTGLANRNEFERRLRNALSSCKSGATQHAFAYCDLDKFKLVNDTAGHQAGDELLKTVSGLLLARLRHRDTVARLGGDEFGLLMEHCPIENAHGIAEKICADIRSLNFEWNGQSFQIGASIGVIAVTSESVDITDVMTRADVACYAAKDLGRNQVYVDRLDSDQVRRRRSELQRVSDVRSTLRNNNLLLYTQPIRAMDRLHGEPQFYELLLRLKDPDGKILTPAPMISTAERYGIMTDIDRWVIGNAFQQCKHLCAAGSMISINLSANSLNDTSLVNFIGSELEKCGIAPGNVCFEITETAAVSNLDSALRIIRPLKELGCQFALDDFGAGISSFRYLKTLPVDWLKIDGGLIQGVVTDAASRAMVRAIQHVADAMGIATIAEWVSDNAMLGPLQDIGVSHVQGYALGKPVPVNQISIDHKIDKISGIATAVSANNPEIKKMGTASLAGQNR